MSETVGAAMDATPWTPSLGLMVRTVILAPLVIYLSYLWYKRRQFVRHMYSIPGPTSWEIFKDALKFLEDTTLIFRWIIEQNKKYNGFWRIWMFNRPQIICADPNYAEIILKGTTHLEKSSNYSVFHYWMGNCLFTMKGEEWRKQRKSLGPLFTMNSLVNFVPIFSKHSYKMTELFAKRATGDNPPEVDVFTHTCMCAFDIIAETTLGTKMNSQETEDKKIIKSYNNVMRLTLWRYFNMPLKWNWVFRFSPTRRELDETIEKINTFTDRLISNRKKYLKKKFDYNEPGLELKPDDDDEQANAIIFDAVINSRTHDEVRKDFRAFTFAGYDTVATGMGWLIFLIAEHPEIQDKIVEELDEIFGDTGREPDMTDLTNMKYLERCIKESLRLYPSAPIFERTLAEDVKLGDHVIPKGVGITFDLYNLHRDPKYWPDPLKYDPDRFLPENSIGRHPYALLSFCAGPRNCLGQLYAMLELKVVVSTLLRRFRLEAAHARDFNKMKVGILLRPKDGLKMRVYERTTHPKLRMNWNNN